MTWKKIRELAEKAGVKDTDEIEVYYSVPHNWDAGPLVFRRHPYNDNVWSLRNDPREFNVSEGGR